MPTVFEPDATNETPATSHKKSPVSVPRKLPLRSVYQTEQFDDFLIQDKINCFNGFVDSLSPFGYSFSRYDNHIVIVLYQLEVNGLIFPEVIGCIRVDGDLPVNPFSPRHRRVGTVKCLQKSDDKQVTTKTCPICEMSSITERHIYTFEEKEQNIGRFQLQKLFLISIKSLRSKILFFTLGIERVKLFYRRGARTVLF